MARGQHAADLLSAEGEDLAIFQFPVNNREILRNILLKMRCRINRTPPPTMFSIRRR
jgi:hypothetical protein